LDSVFDEKLGAGIPESGGLDRVANAASEAAEAFAEKKAGGLHFAGLRLDVSPMRADHH
jgi:hypothetical protein